MAEVTSCENALGGMLLPSNKLMGMCRWIGSHFHDWIDYNVMGLHLQ